MLDRDRKRHRVIEHVGDIEIVFAFGDLERLVAVIVVAVSIPYNNMIPRVDRELHLIKAPVTQHRYNARQFKRQVVEIVTVIKRQRNLDIRFTHVRALHIGKKLLAQMVVHLMPTDRQTLQGQLEFGEFSHF